jgi:hypothetical protein
MLTDTQLYELADKMNIPLETICFKDKLPKKLKYNRSYIINLDDSVDEEGNKSEGTHWTCLQVNKDKDGRVTPLFFDPYGAGPSESIKKFVLDNTGKGLPHTTKDVQSLMNNACGWFCCAFLHFVNAWSHRTGDLYDDAENFMNIFDDLNKSVDWKKNEYLLKMFFQSKDKAKRNDISVIADTNDIMEQDTGGGDLGKI